MRFHVVSLPHTQTTQEYSWCAYTEKVRKFCNMMTDRGHEIILYASEENEARVSELVTCIGKWDGNPRIPQFGAEVPIFKQMNLKVIEEMKTRIQPRDFICLIGGSTQKLIADTFPSNMSVEFGIGYSGVFANYKVFESYAWMHSVYGQGGAAAADGKFFDTVIPNYWDPEDFPYAEEQEDYYLFIGRLIDRKGYKLAAQLCEHMGVKLKIAGNGEPPSYGEYVGEVGPVERGELMSKAIAVFVPTIYVEPFGGVHAEANLCGTPVITTDWGVFTETVTNGVNGYRCRTFQEFLDAMEAVKTLDRKKIRKNAQKRFSTKVVAKQYEDYFNRLNLLWGKGFYQLREDEE